MPGMKPSEKFSIVPEFARNFVRRRADRKQEIEDAGRAGSSIGELRSKLQGGIGSEDEFRSKLQGGLGSEDREELNRLIAEDEMGSPSRMAKGGMVKKYAKGGMVKVRGYGKARSKPCKIC